MKRINVLLVLLCAAMTLFAQNKTMTLKGKCPSSRNGEKLYLVVYAPDGYNYAHQDSVVIKNSKFEFNLEGVEPDEAILYRINEAGKEELLPLCLDYCDTYIKLEEGNRVASGVTLMNATVKGNPADAAVRGIYDRIMSANDLMALYRDTTIFNKIRVGIQGGDMAAAYIANRYMVMLLDERNLFDEYKQGLDKLPAYVLASPVGKKMKEAYERKVRVLSGVIAPDFTLKTPEGETLSMHEFVKGKKVVLIDFWASWCAPCREEGKNVKAIYNDFRDKGFDIFAVSLDSHADAWKKAISDDGFTWTHVSDLKGRQTPLTALYDFYSIPFMVLVNGEGRIVAKNLRGEKLRAKVAEICGKSSDMK